MPDLRCLQASSMPTCCPSEGYPVFLYDVPMPNRCCPMAGLSHTLVKSRTIAAKLLHGSWMCGVKFYIICMYVQCRSNGAWCNGQWALGHQATSIFLLLPLLPMVQRACLPRPRHSGTGIEAVSGLVQCRFPVPYLCAFCLLPRELPRQEN